MAAVPPLWRYFVTDLSGLGITDWSKLASQRSVDVVLNAPLYMSGVVPSDNPQVNLTHTSDGYNDPYLAEGTRLLWGMRKELDILPFYTCRAATMIQLVEDTAEQDDARSHFVGWDPWHYLLSRPICLLNGDLPGENGITFVNAKASVIIATLLRNTIVNQGHCYLDAGNGSRVGEGSQYADWGGTVEYTGYLDSTVVLSGNTHFDRGISVGAAWKQITDLGVCDIVLNPIFDQGHRANYLCELNVYAQAGVTRDEQIFAWDMPGRTLTGISRQQNGAERANVVQLYGKFPLEANEQDASSKLKFGQYWSSESNADWDANELTYYALNQIQMRAMGRQTVNFTPAPERAPRPWQDYQLGDRCPVWASQDKFRKLLDVY